MRQQDIYKETVDYRQYTLPVIVAITFICFLTALGNDFVNWDDDTYIIKNPYLKDLSWNNIVFIFTQPMGQHAVYRPLVYLSYAIEHNFWGLNPKPYHWISLLWHLLNVTLVYKFITKLTKEYSLAVITTLLFAIHPMKVESVAWTMARVDPMFATFFLLGLLAYLNYLANFRIGKLLLSYGCFLLAILCKPTAIVFPLVLLLVDYFYARPLSAKMFLEKLPLLVAAVFFAYLTIKVQTTTLADLTGSFSLVDRVFISAFCIAFYTFVSFLPLDANLSIAHTFPEKVNGLLPLYYYLAPLLVVGLLSLPFIVKKYQRELIFTLGFFLVNLLLVIHLIPYGQHVVADRYVYLPHIGLFLLLAYVARWLKSIIPTKVSYVAIGIFTLCCAVQTFQRNRVWTDSITLWTDAVQKSPRYAYGYFGLATALHDKKEYAKAVEAYTAALQIDSKLTQAYQNRAVSLYAMGEYEAASKDYYQILVKNQSDLGAWLQSGHCFYMLKKYDKAISCYDFVTKLNPQVFEAYLYRGHSKYASNDKAGACRDFKVAKDMGVAEGERLWQEAGCQ